MVGSQTESICPSEFSRSRDLTGLTFNLLTAIKPAHVSRWGQTYWLFKCDCGSEKVIQGGKVSTGRTVSCGCRVRETAPLNSTFYRHGDSARGNRKRLHRIWAAMWARCRSRSGKSYRYYGGRGITVCPEWSDYTVFRGWALANGYRDDLTIDRIDNDGNYHPSNCRWATMAEQNANKRPKGTAFP